MNVVSGFIVRSVSLNLKYLVNASRKFLGFLIDVVTV